MWRVACLTRPVGLRAWVPLSTPAPSGTCMPRWCLWWPMKSWHYIGSWPGCRVRSRAGSPHSTPSPPGRSRDTLRQPHGFVMPARPHMSTPRIWCVPPGCWMRVRCAAALQSGLVSYPHARVLASTFADLPVDCHDSAEPILLQAAEKLDPARLRSVGTRLRETINRDHAERNSARDHARRRLHVSRAFDGMVALDGLLDAEAGGCCCRR